MQLKDHQGGRWGTDGGVDDVLEWITEKERSPKEENIFFGYKCNIFNLSGGDC